VESREAYDTDLRKNVTEAVKTQFILDAIADAREITVDNDDLSAQIVAQAQRSRMSPEQYAQQLQQSGNIAEFVADVRRTKALAQLLEQTRITDASGNVVDLEELRPQTVSAPQAPFELEEVDDDEEADYVVGEDGSVTATGSSLSDEEAFAAEATATEAQEGATEDSGDATKA
jgi:trigger factor